MTIKWFVQFAILVVFNIFLNKINGCHLVVFICSLSLYDPSYFTWVLDYANDSDKQVMWSCGLWRTILENYTVIMNLICNIMSGVTLSLMLNVMDVITFLKRELYVLCAFLCFWDLDYCNKWFWLVYQILKSF